MKADITPQEYDAFKKFLQEEYSKADYLKTFVTS